MQGANAQTVVLEQAKPQSPDAVGSMMYDTDPEVFRNLYARDEAFGRRHLGYLWQQPKGLFSHLQARAAVWEDQVVGIALGCDKQAEGALIGDHLQLMEQSLDRERLQHLLQCLDHGRFLFPPVHDDAWHLQFLAVDAQIRGRGVGYLLLKDSLDRARSAGYARVCLDVYDGNPAMGLYQRCGFKVIVETRVLSLQDAGIGLHRRMELML